MSIENKTKDVQQLVVNQLGVANGLTDNNLADGQVTPAKLSAGHPNWDTAGYATIAKSLTVNGDTNHGSVEVNKAVTGEGNATVDFHSTNATNPDFDARIASYSNGEMNIIQNRPDKPIIFNVCHTDNTRKEAMRLTQSGSERRVGIGTADPKEKLHVHDGNILVKAGGTVASNDHTEGLIQVSNRLDPNQADNDTHCISIDPNEILGRQTMHIRVGRKYNADGTEDTTAGGGRNMHFQVKNPGTGTSHNNVLNVRGDQRGGCVTVGAIGVSGWGAKLYTEYDTGSGEAVHTLRHVQDGDRTMMAFVVGDNDENASPRVFSTKGTIQYNATTNKIVYGETSDYRLKDDIVDIDSTIETVKALKPRNFAWKQNGKRVNGFVAHEVAEVYPQAVIGEKDAMRSHTYEASPEVLDDKLHVVEEAVFETKEVEDYQELDQVALIPVLTKALQEALEKIESLEARVDALENA